MSYSFDPKSRVVHVRFRYPAGRRGVGRYVSLPANSEREALIAWAGIQETLDDLRRGKLDMPPSLNDAQVKDYIVSGGKVLPPAADAPGRFSIQTTGELLDFYDRELTAGAKGDGTRYTEQIHSRHLRRILKPDLPLAELDQKAVQDYVNRRAKEGVSPITIGKELSTLSTIQGWASVLGVVGAREWRRERLTFPKGKEKPPFQTLDQIERRIAKGNLSADDEETLWESLWLNTAQTLDVLDTVNQAEVEPVVYPLFVAAA